MGTVTFELLELFSDRYNCFVCGAECGGRFGLPVCSGDVLPNDWPGEWGGVVVCRSCFEANDNPSEPRPLRLRGDSLEGRPT